MEAADGWGHGQDLLDCLRGTELPARGPKVKGAISAAGLTEEWSPDSESTAEVLDRLPTEGVEGRRVALQLHGEPLPGFVEALRAGGADVVVAPVDRWMPPEDIAPDDRLIDATVARTLDAVTFTGAPAAASLLSRAGGRGLPAELVEAPHHDVLAVCVGPVTALPLQGHGIDTVQPERFRLGPLVQVLCLELPDRTRTLTVAGRGFEIRGHAVLLDGELRPVPPAGTALANALAKRPGRVVSRADLLRAPPGAGSDEHAVETAMTRLRTALGASEPIRTVVRRGYRLALDPAAGTKYGGA